MGHIKYYIQDVRYSYQTNSDTDYQQFNSVTFNYTLHVYLLKMWRLIFFLYLYKINNMLRLTESVGLID